MPFSNTFNLAILAGLFAASNSLCFMNYCIKVSNSTVTLVVRIVQVEHLPEISEDMAS